MGLPNSIGAGFLALAGAMAGLVLVLRVKNRNSCCAGSSDALARWARDVHFSNQQLAAMRSLWQWYKMGKRPAGGTVGLLGTADIADLERKCDISFMPAKYRLSDEVPARKALVLELRELGLDEIEADILAGMIRAGFGPAADLGHYKAV